MVTSSKTAGLYHNQEIDIDTTHPPYSDFPSFHLYSFMSMCVYVVRPGVGPPLPTLTHCGHTKMVAPTCPELPLFQPAATV